MLLISTNQLIFIDKSTKRAIAKNKLFFYNMKRIYINEEI